MTKLDTWLNMIAWGILATVALAGIALLLRAMNTAAALASAQAARCLPYLP